MFILFSFKPVRRIIPGIFGLIILPGMLSSCTPGVSLKEPRQVTGNKYAQHFKIERFTGYHLLTVFNPWQKTRNIKMQYVIAGNESDIPDSLMSTPHIQLPVKKVVVFSTTHIGYIASLNKSETIAGVSGLSYVCDSLVKTREEDHLVFDIGYAPNINYEQIIGINPDLVLVYGIQSSVTGIIERLENIGIPTLIISEYLEPHPLGKTEWLKVFGLVYEEEERAENIFDNIQNEYEKYRQLANRKGEKPSVLVGMPWKETWYMAGGESYTSHLIEDAGGRYLWGENKSAETIPLSMESVLAKTLNADYWINTGSARSLQEIIDRDDRFGNLKVMHEKKVYNNDAILSESGGNAFWEQGVMEPHIILKDMVKVFHPDLLNDYDFVYYRKLE